MQGIIRLPLKNAYNTRELGGYPTKNGQNTKYGQFLRSDDLYQLDAEDIALLLNYGVKAVIDLRGGSELEKYPNPFAQSEEVRYLNAPLISSDVAAPHMEALIGEMKEDFLSTTYLTIIQDASAAMKMIFEFIAEQQGCVLFHCAAGKDRTGVLAMLLLGLVEVNRADIITNYMMTEVYIKENPAIQHILANIPAELMQSKPEYIIPTIDYITAEFGDVERYLLSIGLTEAVLAKVKNKLAVDSLAVQNI